MTRTAPPRPARRFFALVATACVAASLISANHWPARRPDGFVAPARAQAPAKAPASVASSQPTIGLGTVDIDGQILNLAPLNSGTVVEIIAQEGQMIKKGELLLRIDEEPYLNKAAQAKVALKLAELSVRKAERGMALWQSGRDQQLSEIEMSNYKISAGEARLAQLKKLRPGDFTSDNEIRAVTSEIDAGRAGVRALEAKLRGIDASKPDLEREEAEVSVMARQQQVREAEIALERCRLRAEVDGTVLRLNAAIGSQYTPMSRSPAVVFAPAGPRIVRVELDQEFAARVVAGMAAVANDENNAGVVWNGKVVRVAEAFMTKRNAPIDILSPGNNDTKALECIVELANDQPPPRLGQRLRVAIGGR